MRESAQATGLAPRALVSTVKGPWRSAGNPGLSWVPGPCPALGPGKGPKERRPGLAHLSPHLASPGARDTLPRPLLGVCGQLGLGAKPQDRA